MFSKKARSARAECSHADTVTVRNGPIERTICENCGHVSFVAQEGLSGAASREQFERESERSPATVG